MLKGKIATLVSLRYWSNHKKRFFTLALTIIIGAAALCCAALMIRSNKVAEYNDRFDGEYGNYDLVIYEISDDVKEKLTALGGVHAYGSYSTLFQATNENASSTFKVAAFENEISENIYKLDCIRGNYPDKSDEIAIDVAAATAMGVLPFPGEKIKLQLEGENHTVIEQQFVISGVFECYNPGSFTSYKRYPNSLAPGKWQVPMIFLSADWISKVDGASDTVFLQLDDPTDFGMEISGIVGDAMCDFVYNRIISYNLLLGNKDISFDNIESIDEAVLEEDIYRDFFSAIVMPVVVAMIFVIVFLTVYNLIKSVLFDRREQVGILRSIGMSSASGGIHLMMEMLVITLVCITVGIVFGCGLHIFVIAILNKYFGARIETGFSFEAELEQYIKAVTYDPYLISAVVMLLSVLTATFVCVFKMCRTKPIELLREEEVINRKNIKNNVQSKIKNWRYYVNRSIKENDISVIFITCLLFGVSFVGYNYFCALTERDNLDNISGLSEGGLEYWDYIAEKSSDSTYIFNVKSKHSDGISKEELNKLTSHQFVTDYYAEIINTSTRISVKNPSEEFKAMFDGASLRSQVPGTDDEYEKAVYEGEKATIRKIGYSDDEYVFRLPSLGYQDNKIAEYEKYVIDGKINLDKLNSGEEILLVIPDTKRNIAEKFFKAGDTFVFSDVVLTEEEEKIDFNALTEDVLGEPVFTAEVVNPLSETGEMVEYRAYSFGTRKNISVKIGAIVAVPIETAEEYYGISIITSYNAFEKWKLPDNNFTRVCIKTDKTASREDTDIAWYGMLISSSGTSSYSASAIYEKTVANTMKKMSIYLVTAILLLATSTVAIGVLLYSKMMFNSKKLAYFRAIGMSVEQTVKMLILQNLWYPVIGTVFAVIPYSALYTCFVYIRKIIDENGGDSISIVGETTPWYSDIPAYMDLLSYHPVFTLAIMFMVFFMFEMVVCIPQLMYIKKKQIAEGLDINPY